MAYRSRESHRTDEIITKINRTGVMTARRATPLEVSNGYFIHVLCVHLFAVHT